MGRPPGARNGTTGGKPSSTKPTGAGTGKSTRKSTNVVATAGTSNGGVQQKNVQDRSQTNFPYDIRINGFTSLQNAVAKGTPKIKRILTEECDYIMECRVCRNLFRSLPNFITHKLNYCKKAFDSTWCIGLSSIIQSSESQGRPSFDVEYEVDPSLVFINAPVTPSDSNDDSGIEFQNTRTRSVADLYGELAERSRNQTHVPEESSPASSNGGQSNVIKLQVKPLMIPGESGDSCGVVSGGMNAVVVQQRIVSDDPSSCDTRCTTKNEFVKKDTAILGPDGRIVCTAPEKGIEKVVQRLQARLQAKEAQKMAETAKSTLLCDICKTVFDSEKAIRQHKRESPDCGKVSAFKSIILEKSSKPATLSTTPGSTAAQGIVPKTLQSEGSSATSIRVSRVISPSKGRRISQHQPVNGVLKRTSLSPVKKIKMKYSKLDSAQSANRDSESTRKSGDGDWDEKYSCSRCSSSFSTKHEMSMHLALCAGVINFASISTSERPQEKIRISLRNDFASIRLEAATPQASVALNSNSSESQPNIRQRQVSGTSSSSRGNTPTVEENNNKQYKSSYIQQLAVTSRSLSLSSSEEDDNLQREKTSVVPAEDDSEHDSGVSTSSLSKRKVKPVVVATKKAKTIKTTVVKKTSTPPSPHAKVATKRVGVAGISERPEPNTSVKPTPRGKFLQGNSTVFNLRKSIDSRIRKSKRVPRRPLWQVKQNAPTTPKAIN